MNQVFLDTTQSRVSISPDVMTWWSWRKCGKLLTAVRLWADQSKNYDKFTTLEKENDYEIFCIQGEVRT